MSNAEEDIEIPKEELQKINSIVGKATYNDYHWWNLIGIIKNLMQEHTNQTLQELKENFAEELPHNITKVIYGETELNNEESHELAQKVITLIGEAINK